MDQALAGLPRVDNPSVLVGYDTSDDAGVYQLTPECALVQTVDFFTPIVDDPYIFGAISAANSLSDVYAMGGTPISALSILAYPANGDLDDLRQILRGGTEKNHEAGCVIIGGHSVADDEIKFGYAVTGTVHPQRILRNTGARVGDILVLTKPVGTGVISTALKRGIATADHVQSSITSMLTLNRNAADAMRNLNVHGCTDITGFGLLGHAREMAVGSGVTLAIEAASVRFLPGALGYSTAGAHPGGMKNNRDFAAPFIAVDCHLSPEMEALLYDPQTSGGLLISIGESDVASLLAECPSAFTIGRVIPAGTKAIRVV